ncbi:MAG: sigma-70 family RNA polymerase sigma factor [Muribaculaceae bacterium]|nr:sigma-70 family RNA polymerase sigma factor [Muribaculaceae bacterium]MDE6769845.1 sigma-70 family RNA polymerase sigma factor [Muribaculaceae bacterium]
MMARRNTQLEIKLFELLKDGSVSAFNTIYSIYAERLLKYVSKATKNKEDAEEIVHDIFLYLWNNREKLDTTQNLSSLLFSMAYRKRIDFFRRIINLPIYEDYQYWKNELLAEDYHSVEYKEFCEILDRALMTLPERQCQIIKLSRLQGFSNKEIAEKLNISEKTVRNLTSSALKTLNLTLKRLLDK